MKTILIFLALCSGSAFAAPATPAQQTLIAHMVKACGTPMGRGLCRVMNTAVQADACPDQACRLAIFRERYPKGIFVLGSGMFTADEYFRYMDAGVRMCDLIVTDCTADYDGRSCRMARALWRQ